MREVGSAAHLAIDIFSSQTQVGKNTAALRPLLLEIALLMLVSLEVLLNFALDQLQFSAQLILAPFPEKTRMLSARACRLLGYSGSRGSREPAPARTTAARLDEQQRLARWKIFILKSFLVIDVFEKRRRALLVLGKEACKNLFCEI